MYVRTKSTYICILTVLKTKVKNKYIETYFTWYQSDEFLNDFDLIFDICMYVLE